MSKIFTSEQNFRQFKTCDGDRLAAYEVTAVWLVPEVRHRGG